MNIPATSRLKNFVYCPDPLKMTDAEIERELPRSGWLAEMSDLAHLSHIPTPSLQEQIDPDSSILLPEGSS